MRSIMVVLAVAFGLQLAVADEPKKEQIFSGPQPGEKLAGLPLLNVLSDDAKKIDFVANAKGKPTLLVFFHKKTRPAFGLMNGVMRYAQTKKAKLASAAILLTDDVTATSSWLKVIKKNIPKGAIYGVSPDGIEGPGAYGLNRDVELTVLVAKDGKVTANFALVQPSLQSDGPKIVLALAKALGEKAPDTSKLFAARMRPDQKKRPARPNANAQRGGLDPALGTLVRGLIQKDATPEEVDAAAKKIEEFIKGRKDYQKQLGTVINRIIDAKAIERYGSQKAREYLQAWGKKYKPLVDAPKTDKQKTNDKRRDRPAKRESKDKTKKND